MSDIILFDIPDLLDKSLDEIKQILGEPDNEHEDEDTAWQTWSAPGTYRALTIWLDRAAGRIERFEIRFAGFRHEDMPTDPMQLMRAGNLQEHDPRYALRIRESVMVLGQPRGLFPSVYAMLPKPA